MCHHALEERELGGGPFVAGPHRASQTFQALLGDGQVGEHQLEFDRVDVAARIDRTLDMGDVRRFEAANDVEDGVDRADVAEELISESLTLGGAFHQAGDVEDLYGGRDDLLRWNDRFDPREPLVGHRHDAHVRLDRCKWVVGGFCTGCGQSVEEGGLADVGQAHDASLDGHDRSTPGFGVALGNRAHFRLMGFGCCPRSLATPTRGTR